MSLMQITDLTKKFGKKTLFEGFSLTVPENGIIAINGESGKGKTTLFRIIAGLDKKYSGTLDFGSIKKIAYVFQEPRLLPMSTSLENVALPLGNTPEAKEKAKEYLTKVGLENDINTYPDELSGGMKMRVAIARALAYDGDLLLLDEAFNGIDKDTAESIMDIIKEYAKDRPVLVITHIKEHLDYLGCKCIEL